MNPLYMGENSINPLCMTCNRKNDTSLFYLLCRIKEQLKVFGVNSPTPQGDKLIQNMRVRGIMHIHNSCPYGVYCESIQSNNQNLNTQAEQVLRLIAAWLCVYEPKQKQVILHLVAGYFPEVYRFIDQYTSRH